MGDPPKRGVFSERMEELKRALREGGLRATSSRALVLACLQDADGPLAHGEVCDRLEPHGYDRATIYRNLVDLTNAGLALRSDFGDHLWRFELARGEAHDPTAHPHFVCQECGDVSCLPDDAIAVKAKRGAPKALARKKVEIQVRGLCNACE